MFIVDEKIGSKYRYVVLCAQRTKQLLQGAEARVETPYSKPAYVAMEEIFAGKVEWRERDAEPQPPEEQEEGEPVDVETES